TLEAAGVTGLRPGPGAANGIDMAAHELGVTSMHQSDTDFPGSIYIELQQPADRTRGVVADTGDALATWIGDYLQSEHLAVVCIKLRRPGALERHAFVMLPAFAEPVFAVVDLLMRQDAPLPRSEPALPSEVTHARGWSAHGPLVTEFGGRPMEAGYALTSASA